MTHNLIGLRDPLAPFHIVNVASLAAFYPMPVKATYAASKRFLLDWCAPCKKNCASRT